MTYAYPAASHPVPPADSTQPAPRQPAPRRPALARKPSALPVEPVEYQHLLRGPRAAWWRPLASTGLTLVGVGLSFIAFALVIGVATVVLAGSPLVEGAGLDDFNNPLTFVTQNLLLAALIPIAMLATWIAHGIRPGFVSSVLGRFRWGWFGWSLLVATPIWLAYIGIATWADGGLGDASGRPSHWLALVILAFLTTPFQAAGEEYLFRGWLMQQLGAWFKNTYLALGAAIVLSSVVFALAHTSLDPWVLLDLGAFATAAVLLTWRTGGLESAVALHIINNVIVLVLLSSTTGLGDAFVTPDTTSNASSTVLSVVVLTIVTSILWWLAGKRGVARVSNPAATGELTRG